MIAERDPRPFQTGTPEVERRAEHLTRLLAAIRAVSDEGSESHGMAFFRTFTRRLSEVLQADYAFVGRLGENGENGENGREVHTLALFGEGTHQPDITYELKGTPCWNPASGRSCAHADDVQSAFPDDPLLGQMGIRAYAGIPLRLATGETVGILVVLSKRPLDDPEFALSVLWFFGTRAALELQELKVAERLRERDFALRRLMGSNVVGFAALSRDGVIQDANEAFLSLLGLSREELEEGALRWDPLVAPELREPLEALGAGGLCETEMLRRGGARVSVLLGTARDASDGRVTMLVLDQTERVRAERERQWLLAREQAALTQAQEANRAKDRFLAVISHELRNPLTPIAAAVQLLRRRVSGPAAQEPLKILERNVRLEARLVDDLLDLSRMARGTLAVVPELVPLDRPLEDTLAAEREGFTAAGVALESSLEPDLWADADAGRVSQILLNLLSNARKSTTRGGRVRVSLQRKGEFARLTVEDTGQGIAPEALSQLFNPFSKISVKGPTSAGLGIGLSIVRSLSELHGGRAWAESEGLGRGSQFFVELPLRPALPAPGAEQPLVSGKGTIVVVEDNPDARQILAMSLTDLGFSVQGFGSAEAALEALPHLAPDIMVADIGLPGIDGVELLLRARQLPGLNDLRAIAATAWGQPEDAERIRQAGFDDHFVKPFDVQELVDRIDERIAERQGGACAGAAPLPR